MSGTPETDNLARGNHVVPTEWAEQLERERDKYKTAILECLEKNCHLADGEDCTLIGLKRALR